MKLRNKKTGKILKEARSSMTYKDNIRLYDEISDEYYSYTSLAELNAEWEDYEEPKDYYIINLWGEVSVEGGKYQRQGLSELGLTFETKEEAEKAVEKLKAWKRLKDKGFHWLRYNSTPAGNSVEFYINDWDKEATRYITLLFGGEE